jgi:hypothetical protein
LVPRFSWSEPGVRRLIDQKTEKLSPGGHGRGYSAFEIGELRLFVRTGERTVLEYLVEPVIAFIRRGLREP